MSDWGISFVIRKWGGAAIKVLFVFFSSFDPCHGWQARSRTTYFKFFPIVSSYRYYILCVATLKCFKVCINCKSSVNGMIMDMESLSRARGFWEFHNCIVYKLSRLDPDNADTWHNPPSRWRARVTSAASWPSRGTGGLSPGHLHLSCRDPGQGTNLPSPELIMRQSANLEQPTAGAELLRWSVQFMQSDSNFLGFY